MTRHGGRRFGFPTRVIVLTGMAVLLLALDVALAMAIAPHPYP